MKLLLLLISSMALSYSIGEERCIAVEKDRREKLSGEIYRELNKILSITCNSLPYCKPCLEQIHKAPETKMQLRKILLQKNIEAQMYHFKNSRTAEQVRETIKFIKTISSSHYLVHVLYILVSPKCLNSSGTRSHAAKVLQLAEKKDEFIQSMFASLLEDLDELAREREYYELITRHG